MLQGMVKAFAIAEVTVIQHAGCDSSCRSALQAVGIDLVGYDTDDAGQRRLLGQVVDQGLQIGTRSGDQYHDTTAHRISYRAAV